MSFCELDLALNTTPKAFLEKVNKCILSHLANLLAQAYKLLAKHSHNLYLTEVSIT